MKTHFLGEFLSLLRGHHGRVMTGNDSRRIMFEEPGSEYCSKIGFPIDLNVKRSNRSVAKRANNV